MELAYIPISLCHLKTKLRKPAADGFLHFLLRVLRVVSANRKSFQYFRIL